MSTRQTRLHAVVTAVEARLAAFYGFAPMAEAAAHLVSREELKASLGERVASLPEFRARGGVFLSEAAADEMFIGIHLDDQVAAPLDADDPTARLSDGNLDAFCIVVEEVSHFHLILNRAAAELGVSKLELEWQGEVDKLLVCAQELKAQSGDFHLEPLARKLYDDAAIVADDAALYWEATRHAARFWRAAGRMAEPLGAEVRALLRRSYRMPWGEKVAAARKAS